MMLRRVRRAALIAAITLPLLSAPAQAQQPIGWLVLYLSQYNAVLSARIDHQGWFRGGWSDQALWVTPSAGTKVVSTAGGLLTYDPVSGAAKITKLRNTGQISHGSLNQFAPGWDHILASGTFLFFYNSVNLAGMIGHVTPSGSFVQTQSWGPGSFGVWTDLVATDNNVVFYNRQSGIAVTGYISPYGTWYEVAVTSFLPNCDSLIGAGGYLLCVQANQRHVQVIDLEAPGNPVVTHTLELNRPYDRVVRHGSDVVMYETASGSAMVGHVDETGQFVQTDEQYVLFYPDGWPFGSGADRVISTGDALVFYQPGSGLGKIAVGRVDRAGVFHELQRGDFFESVNQFVATAAR